MVGFQSDKGSRPGSRYHCQQKSEIRDRPQRPNQHGSFALTDVRVDQARDLGGSHYDLAP